MLSAQNRNGDILASEAVKEDGPFTCPMCGSVALLKKGQIKIHHFAHKPPTDCAYGVGESEDHRKAKLDIYEALSKHPGVSKLKLERPLGEVRPDISFYLRGVPVAIEVQISALSLATIDKRTKAYARKGICLLWTSPLPSALNEWVDRYSLSFWEKYLHAMYFGKVYYWISGEILLPIRFDNHFIEVPSASWYESDGTENGADGYSYRSKRYRTPCDLEPTRITELSPVHRKAWRTADIDIPAARLWCEPYRKS